MHWLERFEVLFPRFIHWLEIKNWLGLRRQVSYLFLFNTRLKLERKGKRRPTTWSWFEFDLSVELLNNCIKDYQTKTNAIFVHSLIILDVTELFKEFMSLVFFDSKSSVFYNNIQRWWTSFEVFFYRNDMLNVASLCVLQGIRLKSQNNLEQPWVITNDFFLFVF
jgi:hypothetical protein